MGIWRAGYGPTELTDPLMLEGPENLVSYKGYDRQKRSFRKTKCFFGTKEVWVTEENAVWKSKEAAA